MTTIIYLFWHFCNYYIEIHIALSHLLRLLENLK